MIDYPICFRCSECTVEEPNLHSLEIHIWSRHLKELPFHCAFCDYPSVNYEGISKHYSEHHSGKIPMFKRILDDEKRVRDIIANSIVVQINENQETLDDSNDHMSNQQLHQVVILSDGYTVHPGANTENDDYVIDEEQGMIDGVEGDYIDLDNEVFIGAVNQEFLEDIDDDEVIDGEEDDEGVPISETSFYVRQRRIEQTINLVAREGAHRLTSAHSIADEASSSGGNRKMQNESAGTTAVNKKRRLRCQECMMWFPNMSKLNEHMRKHTKERPYRCEICGTGFTQGGSMKTHMRLHTGESPFPCQWDCGRSFASSSARRQHERIHSGERPYVCSICHRSFTKNSHCTRHIRSQHRITSVNMNDYVINNNQRIGGNTRDFNKIAINMGTDLLHDLADRDEKTHINHIVNEVIDSVHEQKFDQNFEESITSEREGIVLNTNKISGDYDIIDPKIGISDFST